MSRILTRWSLGIALLAGLTPAHAQEAERTRWVLAIGVHEGTEAQDRLRHAVADARRFSDVLRDLGDVGPERSVVLEDPTPEALKAGLVDLAARLARARQAGERPEVVVYYSGHSDDRGLTPWGGRVTWDELRDLVAALPADMRVVVLDSCASGAFVRGKGGVHVEGFLDDASHDVRGDVFLTSASADESAQESDRLGGSYFTHHLVVGLRGAADADGDRRVTLDEAYDYAYRQTVSVTELSWAGAQHPTYAIDVTGRGDVVLTDLDERTAALSLAERLDGEVSIRTTDGTLVAEVVKRSGREVRVAVPAGRYTVRLRQADGAYKTRVVVEEGSTAAVTAEALDAISLEVTRLRGPSERLWTQTHAMGFHLAPKLGSYGFREDIRTRGFSFNVLGVIHPELVGFELGVASWTRGDVDGMAVDFGMAVSEGRVRGWQLAGAYAHARQIQGIQWAGVSRVLTDTDGMQLGAFTWTEGRLRGLQWGVLNLVDGRAPEGSVGWQLSFLYGRVGGSLRGLQMGFINDADRVHGLQAGVFNATKELRGFQLGLVNIVTEDSSGGESLGVINAVKDGYHAFELASDGLSPVSLRIKTGSRHLYTVFRFGWDPSSHAGSGWVMGGGVGGHVRKGRFVFDGDYTVLMDERSIQESFSAWPKAVLMEWQLSPGIQLTEGFAVFAGGSLGFGTTVDGSPASATLVGDTFTPMSVVGPRQGSVWYGNYHLGIRVQF